MRLQCDEIDDKLYYLFKGVVGIERLYKIGDLVKIRTIQKNWRNFS